MAPLSTNTMDIPLLKESILEHIQDIPVGLQWKMINIGMQRAINLADQVQALHIFVDELDVTMAKLLLIALFTSQPGNDHVFPLHVCMRLVPEINSVLNTKGWKMLIN